MNITGRRLCELRKKKRLSQQKVADYLGISRTAYNKYERGGIRPTRKLESLASLFGVSVDYILGLEGAYAHESEDEISSRAHGQIKKYLVLSEGGQEIVDLLLNAVYEKEFRPHKD